MTPDCSLEAQHAALAQYPDLQEHGFNGVGGLPLTDPAEMTRLVKWIGNHPPHPKESSYAYKHRAEDGRDWNPRTGAQIDGESADVGYVSEGEMILACILAGYKPVKYSLDARACTFKKLGETK